MNILKFLTNKKRDEDISLYVSQMQMLKLANLKLRELYEKCLKFSINKDLIKIIKTSDSIFKELTKNKKKIVKMNLFIEYYIQEIIKILENYIQIKKFKDKESIQTCETIENFIKCVVIAFNNIYKDLIKYDKTDMEVDIRIMLNELKKNFDEGNE